MKKVILIICLLATGIVNAKAQTPVIVRRPVGRVVVAPARPVIVSPVRRVIVRPAVVLRPAVTFVRPAARRRVAVVHPLTRCGHL
ncbi:hypothetical protein ACFP1I_32245 [Dyadobacter subterraneus]|uniref:Uncharacterized protein n=1 Tax=Dyadobacter subterraneus TaxID=2773304 RepID=A0ABR9WDX1_9BACT|nr:hypothetical protein [Dyadobacter subterraneus]MBE9463692.1 hypothetical protein [Dyadobacter subterraneus]